MAQGSKYWVFVLGFALGGYSTGLTKYATILSTALAVLQEVLQGHCIFFQLGIAAGVFIKLTRL